jgi:hypothetical protein
MLTRILIALTAIIFSTLQLYSQDKPHYHNSKASKPYLGIGYYVSGSLSAVNQFNNENTILPGYGALLELVYNDSKRDNLLVLGKHSYNTKDEYRHIETYELTVGPRIVIAKDEDIYGDFTIGGTMVSKILRYKDVSFLNEEYFNYVTKSDFGLGVAAAITKKFPVNRNIALTTRLRMLNIISFNKEYYLFVSLNCGASFNSQKPELKNKQQESHSSIAIYAGLNKPDLNIYNDYLWGGCYSIEFTYKTSRLIELLVSGTYNNIVQKAKKPFVKHYIGSITGGGRFILNETFISPFLELGAGYYNYYPRAAEQSGEYYSPTKEYPGIYTGTGFKVKAYSIIDVIAKSDFNLLFTENEATANYLILNLGLRINM